MRTGRGHDSQRRGDQSGSLAARVDSRRAQRLGLQLEEYPVRGYAAGRRARREKARRCSSTMWRQGTGATSMGWTETLACARLQWCLVFSIGQNLQEYELCARICKHEKCRGNIGLQLFYLDFCSKTFYILKFKLLNISSLLYSTLSNFGFFL